jgi:tetrahydromethanopterin S-methyltransferase subunit C
MSLIDFSIMIGQWAAIAGCCTLLLKLTSLPFWATFLISLPVGAVVGAIIGVGLGITIDSAFQKWKRTP